MTGVACEAPDAFPVVASLRPKNSVGGREATTGNASGASQAMTGVGDLRKNTIPQGIVGSDVMVM